MVGVVLLKILPLLYCTLFLDHAGTEPTLTAGAQDAWVEPRVDDAGSLTRRAARVKRKHRKRENQAMITPAYVRTMAEYNAEMNRRLYGAAGGLSDAERRADRGAFFHSIHGTLAHLLWGDAQWMSRFDDWPRPATPIKESDRYIADWGELCAARQKADADIARWVDDSWFDGDMSWPSQAAGREVTALKRVLVAHFFNHQTHHRGQAHALITAAGQSTSDTDLFLVVPKIIA
jgi:uncharacterized damage-inducible protein DinB